MRRKVLRFQVQPKEETFSSNNYYFKINFLTNFSGWIPLNSRRTYDVEGRTSSSIYSVRDRYSGIFFRAQLQLDRQEITEIRGQASKTLYIYLLPGNNVHFYTYQSILKFILIKKI